MLLWSLSVSLVHKTAEIPETLSAMFNKWWGRCCNRPSVGVCILTINVHELHAWKKIRVKKKVVLHHSPALHSLFPLSRNTSCQRALLRSRTYRTIWFVLFFDLLKKVTSCTFFYLFFNIQPSNSIAALNHCFLMLCHFLSDRKCPEFLQSRKRGSYGRGLAYSIKKEVAAGLYMVATPAFQHGHSRSRSWIVPADETR